MRNSVIEIIQAIKESVDVQRYELRFSNGNTTPAHQGIDDVIVRAKEEMSKDPNLKWVEIYPHGSKGKEREPIMRIMADGHVVNPTATERKEARHMELLTRSRAAEKFLDGETIVIEPKDYNKRERHNQERFRLRFHKTPSFQSLGDVTDHLKKQYSDVEAFAFYRKRDEEDDAGQSRIVSQ